MDQRDKVAAERDKLYRQRDQTTPEQDRLHRE